MADFALDQRARDHAGGFAALGDHRAAFADYDARMRPCVEKGQSLPPGTPGLANPQSDLGRKVLGTALKLAASPVAKKLGGLAGRVGNPPADEYELPPAPRAVA